jgi:ribA/ribD-fused uncharacterized protein
MIEVNNSVKGEISSFRGRYLFLSNMYEHPILYNGMTWKSSEHAYQAMKATNKIDMFKIKAARTPKLSKTIGHQCECRPDWNDVKVDIMREVIKAKFSDPALTEQLLSTGDCELIEGNDWWDREWGCIKDEDGDWTGKNWLGVILMEVRDKLNKGEINAKN